MLDWCYDEPMRVLDRLWSAVDVEALVTDALSSRVTAGCDTWFDEAGYDDDVGTEYGIRIISHQLESTTPRSIAKESVKNHAIAIVIRCRRDEWPCRRSSATPQLTDVMHEALQPSPNSHSWKLFVKPPLE